MAPKRDFFIAPFALVAILLLVSSVSAHLLSTNSPADSPFRLPVGPGLDAYVFQGNAGDKNTVDHVGAQQYAFDFTVGVSNFVIVAAASGTVIGVDDSSTTQCNDSSCWTSANYVLIQNDGTYNGQQTAALYLHLLPHSAKVRVGYHVNQGDQLGLADTTGWATGPHLHFQVEDLPSQNAIQQKSAGWWFTQSIQIQFSNPEVLAQDKDGIPRWGQTFHLPGKVPTPNILPGGLWISPNDGDTVSDTVHFAAWAYPTHPSDPAIKSVNFTINVQGTWKPACPPVLPPTATPGPAPTPLPASPPAPGAQVFACDANLQQLGVPYGQFQVSFDVYDIAGHINLAPNGVHTLTYLQPTPTPKPIQRTITSQQSQSNTVNATGYLNFPGTHDQGTVIVSNYDPNNALSFPAGYTVADEGSCPPIPGGQAGGFDLVFDAPVSLPPDPDPNSPNNPPTASIPGHIAEIGHYTQGCFAADLYSAPYGFYAEISVDSNFGGGENPYNGPVVQQSDIDGVANSLEASTKQAAVADLNSQLQPNEHLVGAPQCTYNVTSDHTAGDEANTVTVTVKATCTATAST